MSRRPRHCRVATFGGPRVRSRHVQSGRCRWRRFASRLVTVSVLEETRRRGLHRGERAVGAELPQTARRRVLTHRISAWAGPVTGTVAVLCAAIAIAYASGTRVAVSIPAAADIGGPTPTGTSSGVAAPPQEPALTFVHPTHPVQVLDESDDVNATVGQADVPSPSTRTPSATRRGDDSPEPTHDAKPAGAPVVIPTVMPTPDSAPAQPTHTWSDDDPSRSPGSSSSQWKPTGTPSWSPSASHSHHDDDGGTSGASQSDS